VRAGGLPGTASLHCRRRIDTSSVLSLFLHSGALMIVLGDGRKPSSSR